QSGACDPYEQLTTREREVLHWTVEGKTAPQIASLLEISVRTVETHRANVMRKLGTRSKSDLVRYVVERAERQADPRIRGGARRDPARHTTAANRR
ncbi:MAG TPA: helix-turn-helix transcriptional regulator, partial [Armatimonadota bacterium]|nr:helix-turn-helix transcriptional regulator [Armatimonadota bacterium]